MISFETIRVAPWEVLVISLLLMAAPALASRKGPPLWHTLGPALLLAITLLSSDGRVAFAAAAVAGLLHAAAAWRLSRTGAAMLAASGVLALAAAVMINQGQLGVAVILSCLAIALRAGVMPVHFGVASLCDRAPVLQIQQLASAVALVFIYLRFLSHETMAIEVAPALIRIGAVAALVGALIALAQNDLRGLYRSSTVMHGGMLLAGVGGASFGHFAAALLVAVAMATALAGFGMMVTALEERSGTVWLTEHGGRVHAFPRLAAFFAVFGGAAVGLPGTVGFVADDLLLHSLWLASPSSAVLVVFSTAILAVTTLMAYVRVFLGRARRLVAPDLLPRERAVAAALLVVLLAMGIVPGALLGPAETLFAEPSGSQAAGR